MSGFEVAEASGASKGFVSALLSKEVFTFFSTWDLDTSLLDQLETQLNSVEALLRDAEEKLIDKNVYVEEWAQKARFAIYDADDFLDRTLADVPGSNEVRTNIINTIESSEYSTEDKIKSNVKDVVPAIHPCKKTIEVELGEIIEKLQFLAAQKDTFGLKEKSELPLFTIGRPTFINETFTIYGRSEDKHTIIRMLNSREGNDDAFRVIPIVGKSGIGKTTLACLVFHEYKGLNRSFGLPSWLGRLAQREDNRSSPYVFDVKGWICVSDEFDATHVIKSLLESINGQESKVNCSLKSLQHELKKQLQGKKYLIVLDDFWSNKPEDWDVLQTCFSVGALGSRVIITTRSTEVARTVTTIPDFFYELDKLSRDESWFLFEKIVFRDENSSKHLTLTNIGLDIVSRCNGLPMSIKMIGRLLLLKGNDEIEWRSVLNNKIWENSNIIPSIWLSYYDLPSGVRKCFAYCSIFPKGYLFTMEEVIMLWIGEGLIEKFCEDNRCEDVARAYFTHLCSKLFFQESGSSRSEFVMHDLVHDLALYVLKGLCVNLHNVTVQSRRLSYVQGKEESLLNNMSGVEVRHLRTFLPLRGNGFPKNGEGFYFNNELLGNLMSKFKLLRVLSLNGYAISKLPDSVGDMKLLRYLDLSCTDIDYLPNKVSQLYNLRILLLSGCRNLTRLPSEMCNLVNLRHLYIDGTNLEEMPDGIGKLTNIRTLSNYVVGGGKSKQLREFKELLNLQGKLRISRLNNVEDAKDVVVAGFKKKEYIEELVLEWEPTTSARGTEVDDEKVLDAIDAHNNLKSLAIKGYGGKKLSDWIVGVGPSFTGTVSLSITDCSNCEALPSLGNLPFLKNLKIERLNRVESIGEEFYGDIHNPFQALEELHIDGMKVLKKWWFPKGDRLGFQMLQDVQIVRCPELTKISYCFPSLSQLLIESCYNLFKVEMRGEAEGGSSSITARPHPFQSIRIFSCPKLVEIPISFAKSDSFEIENCERLHSVIRFQHGRKLTLRDDSVSIPAEAALEDCRDEVMEESAQKCFACGFGCKREVKKCSCKMGTIIVPEIVPPPADDCLRLKKALDGWGAEEEELIRVMGRRNATQRKQITEAYQDLYKESLLDRIDSELSGDFKKAVLLWVYDPAERDARLIRKALKATKQLVKQLEVLVEVACTTPPTHLSAVRKAYSLLFHCSIEQDIRSNVPSTPLQKLLLELVRSFLHDSGEVDTNLAISEAADLYKCIKARLFESGRFLSILSTRNIFQLRETFECYQRSFKNPIDQDIKSSGRADSEAVFSLMARCIHKPEMHFAEVIRKATIGLGTDEDSITRAIVTRAEVDMVKIKSAYSEMYKSTVESAVAGDTSGYYKAFLMTLLGFSDGTSGVQFRNSKVSVVEDGSVIQSSEVIDESVSLQEIHTICKTLIMPIKDAEIEPVYHSSESVQAVGSHHPILDLTISEELGVSDAEPIDYDVEGVLKKQETHDLICPNCCSCITHRVILKTRKRVPKDTHPGAKRERIEIMPIKDAEIETVYHSSKSVQAEGSHHPTLDSTISEELGVIYEGVDYDVEGVLKKQETHDLFCPNCYSCITHRVILRKRKRVPKDTHPSAMRDRIEEDTGTVHGALGKSLTIRGEDTKSCEATKSDIDPATKKKGAINQVEVNTTILQTSEEKNSTETSSLTLEKHRFHSVGTDYLTTHAQLAGKDKKTETGSNLKTQENMASTIMFSPEELQIKIEDNPNTEFDSFKDSKLLQSEDTVSAAVQGAKLLEKLLTDLVKGSNITADDERILIENEVKQRVSCRTELILMDKRIPVTGDSAVVVGEQVVQVGEARDWDILKSIVYGGLIESITSLGVVASAAGAETATLNIVVLGLANLIGGLILIFHNLKDLRKSVYEGPSNQVDRYHEVLGRRSNFKLHAVIVVLSFLIFGLIPIATYAFTFRKSDNRDYKSLAVIGASLISVTLLSLGKAHTKNPPRAAFKALSYYLTIAISAFGLSYVAGKLLNELIEKTGWFDTTSSSLNSISFPATVMPSQPAWGSY